MLAQYAPAAIPISKETSTARTNNLSMGVLGSNAELPISGFAS